MAGITDYLPDKHTFSFLWERNDYPTFQGSDLTKTIKLAHPPVKHYDWSVLKEKAVVFLGGNQSDFEVIPMYYGTEKPKT